MFFFGSTELTLFTICCCLWCFCRSSTSSFHKVTFSLLERKQGQLHQKSHFQLIIKQHDHFLQFLRNKPFNLIKFHCHFILFSLHVLHIMQHLRYILSLQFLLLWCSLEHIVSTHYINNWSYHQFFSQFSRNIFLRTAVFIILISFPCIAVIIILQWPFLHLYLALFVNQFLLLFTQFINAFSKVQQPNPFLQQVIKR